MKADREPSQKGTAYTQELITRVLDKYTENALLPKPVERKGATRTGPKVITWYDKNRLDEAILSEGYGE